MNEPLFGHENAEAEFRAARAGGRLHHAWLISGPKGIGKATLARRFAQSLLAPDAAALARMNAGSHTDFLLLAPPEDPDKDETKREIPVEQARAAGDFLAHTPAEGDWRVVLVDSADELNANAANALLKVLEEPPPRAVLLLVSHNPGRLLPTIRSRCRSLKLPPLSPEAFAQAMRSHAPELDAAEVRRLGVLSRFSPGVALALHARNGLELYENFVRQVGQGSGAMAFAERIMSGQPHANWQIAGQLAARFFERTVELGLGQAFFEVAPGEKSAAGVLLASLSPQGIAELHARAEAQFSVAARLHLDYKTAMVTFLNSLPQAA